MNHDQTKPDSITGRIYQKAFDLLEQNPEGIRWSDLLRGNLSKNILIRFTNHPKGFLDC